MNHASESLVGSIERVTFHNTDNGFADFNTAVKGHNDLITVVGHLAFAIFGDKVFEIIEKQSERLTDVRGIKAVAFAINRAVVRRRYCGLNRRLAAVAPWL